MADNRRDEREGEVMRKNPYLQRAAIRDMGGFFGRKKEVSRIFSRIGAARPQSVSIVGERRIGKSSLLNYVSFHEVYSLYLDNFEKYLFIKLDFQERKNISLEDFLRDFISSIMQKANFTATLTPDFDGVRNAVISLQNKGLKLIILFDEFDAITSNPQFGEEFFSFFRSLANNYDMAYITSSRKDLHELCHTSVIADSPFFNIFSTINLGTFTLEEAHELICLPSARAGVPLERFEDKIIELSGFFPFFIQIACSAFFEELESESDTINYNLIKETFKEDVIPHFSYLWDHFSNEERNVLRSIKNGEEIHPSYSYIVKKLKKAGYINITGNEAKLFTSIFEQFIEQKDYQEKELLGETVNITPSKKQIQDFFAKNDQNSIKIIGGFRIVRKLGEGGMGAVYKAFDEQLSRPVAIKVLLPHMAGETNVRMRFMKEARAASQLNHPNVCTIYQVGNESGLDFIVMEYVEGRTLRSLIKEGAFDPISCARIAIQIADGLQHAHSKGIIHRDIKPANIMISSEGRVKILDFGLVKWANQSLTIGSAASGLTENGAIIGTVNYMSPEQLKGEKVDHRTDLFSFGVVFYEMLVGVPPFRGENYITIMHSILYNSPEAFPAGIHSELVDLANYMLVKEPDSRIADASLIKERLISFLQGSGNWNLKNGL